MLPFFEEHPRNGLSAMYLIQLLYERIEGLIVGGTRRA